MTCDILRPNIRKLNDTNKDVQRHTKTYKDYRWNASNARLKKAPDRLMLCLSYLGFIGGLSYHWFTSRTAQGGGGSFKDRSTLGNVEFMVLMTEWHVVGVLMFDYHVLLIFFMNSRIHPSFFLSIYTIIYNIYIYIRLSDCLSDCSSILSV